MQSTNERIVTMVTETGASLSRIDETLVLPEPQQLIGITGHTHEEEEIGILWGDVKDQPEAMGSKFT